MAVAVGPRRVPGTGYPKCHQTGAALWIALTAALVLFPRVAVAAPEQIDSLAEFRKLSREDAAQSHPMQVQAVVTFWSKAGSFGFIQEGAHGTYVNRSTDMNSQDPWPDLRPGDRVRIGGWTRACGYSPCIAAQRIERVGRTELPAASAASAEDLLATRHEAQRIRVRCVVRMAEPLRRAAWPQGAMLQVEISGRRFRTMVAERDEVVLRDLTDALVEMDGISGASFNRQGQLIAPVLYVQRLGDVHVRRRAASASERVPESQIGAILQYGKFADVNQRVKVRGLVTQVQPGNSYYIQSGDRGLLVWSTYAEEVAEGDLVEVIGVPAGGGWTPALQYANYRKLGIAALPEPIPIAGKVAMEGTHDSRLVSIVGRIEAIGLRVGSPQSAGMHVVTDDKTEMGGLILRADEASVRDLPPGTRIRATGILRVEPDELLAGPRNARILISSARDIAVLARPPWWTAQRLVIALLFTTAGALVSLAAVLFLRRKVHQQVRELGEAKEASERANQAKTAFLAHLSHEIRTPMNGVLGMTELARSLIEEPEARECLNMATESARHLLTLLNDVLDVSKIEAGKLELEAVPFSLRDVTRDSLQLVHFLAQNKSLTLEESVDANVLDSLVGDPTRLRQILLNLLNNACKFTERGSVRLEVKPVLATANRVRLRFRVIDSGAGISREAQNRIFEAFEQEDKSTTRRYGGTGLGLAISTQLVRLMGGEIRVDSELERGSTFWFDAEFGRNTRAPRQKGSGTTPLATLEATPIGAPVGVLRVLVAEDNRVNSLVIQRLLERNGHIVILAKDGLEAVQKFGDERPDIVLMDIQMPVMDGFDATRTLRERYPRHAVPILALTAHAIEGYREQCLAAGMNDYLTKPIREEELIAKMETLAGASSQRQQ